MKEVILYFKSNYGVDANTVLTIFVSTLVFAIGLLLQRINTFITSLSEKKKIRNLFELNLETLIRHTFKQHVEYEKSALLLVPSSDAFFVLTRVSIPSAEIIERIGYQNIYEAYFTGFRINFFPNNKMRLKAFNKIWAIISSIKFVQAQSFSRFDEFIKLYNEYNEHRNSALSNHQKFVDNLFTEINFIGNISVETKKYIEELDAIHYNWQHSKNRTNMTVVHRKLILPTRILNRKNNRLPLANSTNENLLKATHGYINQNKLLKANRIQVGIYSNNFKVYSRTSKMCLNILRSNFDQIRFFKGRH
jgi:hypothetical protein